MILKDTPDFVLGCKCWCGKDAFQKIEVVHEDTYQGHAMNAYVCKEHFYFAMRGTTEEAYAKRLEVLNKKQ